MEQASLGIILLIVGLIVLVTCFVTVRQGTITVITVFGKYNRIMRPGLNLRVPIIQKIVAKVSTQQMMALSKSSSMVSEPK